MTSKAPPFLTVTSSAGKLSWKDYEELFAWMQALINDWSWVSGQTESGNNAWNNLTGLHHLNQELSNLRNYLNNESSIASLLDSIKSKIVSLLDSYPWLLSGSPFKAYVDEIRQKNIRVAANIVALHMNLPSMSNWQEMPINMQAVVEYELYKRNFTKATKPITSELEQLVSGIRTKLTDFDVEQKELVSIQTTRLSDIEAGEELRKEQFTASQKSRTDEWNSDLASTKKQLEGIKSAYDDFMSLQAPAKYWRTKQRKHFRLAIAYAVLTIAFFIGGGFFLAKQIVDLYKVDAVATSTKSVATAASTAASGATAALSVIPASISEQTKNVELWKIGFIAIQATLLFWALRVLIRLLLSNIHLENDASERVTMAMTYLALLRRNKVPQNETINAILMALFRPSGDGIVKDEGVPVGVVDMLLRRGP